MAQARRATSDKPRRVLVTRFSALGDVAMTLPVVYGACRANPGVAFIFATRRHMAKMFVNPPANLTVFAFDPADYEGLTGLKRLYDHLSSKFDFDAVADFHSVLRTRVIDWYARRDGLKVVSLDKSRSHRRALTRRHNKMLVPLRPMLERYADVITALGLHAPGPFVSLFPPEGAPAERYAILSEPKRRGERWVAVAPFAKYSGKIYPAGLMEKALRMIVEDNPDVRVFLLGAGASEEARLDKWGATIERTTSLAGNGGGLAAELALLSHVDAVVAMDSANMHLAALVGAPTVSIWGATHPYCGFSAFGADEANAVQLAIECRPCSIFGNKTCRRGDYLCLAGISPRTVADRVNSLLRANTPKK